MWALPQLKSKVGKNVKGMYTEMNTLSGAPMFSLFFLGGRAENWTWPGQLSLIWGVNIRYEGGFNIDSRA